MQSAHGHRTLHLGTLTSDQELATYFPICEDEHAFQKFLKSTRRGIKIADLYGSKEIAALESVQPFSIAAEAEAVGVGWTSTRQDDLNRDAGHRLDVLWNVDKRRRLPGLVWFTTGWPASENQARVGRSHLTAPWPLRPGSGTASLPQRRGCASGRARLECRPDYCR